MIGVMVGPVLTQSPTEIVNTRPTQLVVVVRLFLGADAQLWIRAGAWSQTQGDPVNKQSRRWRKNDTFLFNVGLKQSQNQYNTMDPTGARGADGKQVTAGLGALTLVVAETWGAVKTESFIQVLDAHQTPQPVHRFIRLQNIIKYSI